MQPTNNMFPIGAGEGRGRTNNNKNIILETSQHSRQRKQKQPQKKRHYYQSMPRAVSRLFCTKQRSDGKNVVVSEDVVVVEGRKKGEGGNTLDKKLHNDTVVTDMTNLESSSSSSCNTVALTNVGDNDHHHHSVGFSVGSRFVEVELMNTNDQSGVVSQVMGEGNECNDGINGVTLCANDDCILKASAITPQTNDNDVKASQTEHSTMCSFLDCIVGRDGDGAGCNAEDQKYKNNDMLCGSSFAEDVCTLLCSPRYRDSDRSTEYITCTKNENDTYENMVPASQKSTRIEDEQIRQHPLHQKTHDNLRSHNNSIKRAKIDIKSPPLPALTEIHQESSMEVKNDCINSSSCNDRTTDPQNIFCDYESKDMLHPKLVTNDSHSEGERNNEEQEASFIGKQSTVPTKSVANCRPPTYLRSMSATSDAYRNIGNDNIMGYGETQMHISDAKHGIAVSPYGRTQNLQHLSLLRGRSLQLFPRDLQEGHTSPLPLAFSLSLQRQYSYGTKKEGVNVVSSSSSDTDRSAMDSEDIVDVGGDIVTIASLASFYRERYLTLCEDGKVHVRFLDTYQGRNPSSTNGCTVIAPLMCVQYFTFSFECDERRNETNNALEYPWSDGLSDELINHVIDDQAAAILMEVRNKLNLEQDAFIIPSDVHDHFIKEGLLSTSQFVGVCGGNILDDLHIQALKSALLVSSSFATDEERERWKNKRIAATFFFHGHVVALHVVEHAGIENGRVSIELIDSLPDPETWLKCTSNPLMNLPSSSSNWKNNTSKTFHQWCGEEVEGGWERPVDYEDGVTYEELPRNAVRVRCTDVENFDTLIRHYACSKFTKEEQAFINCTAWDDKSCYCEYSFDPRVFQAFVWAEAE